MVSAKHPATCRTRICALPGAEFFARAEHIRSLARTFAAIAVLTLTCATGSHASADTLGASVQPAGDEGTDAPINGEHADIDLAAPEIGVPWTRDAAAVTQARSILKAVRDRYRALEGVRDDDVRMLMTARSDHSVTELADEQLKVVLTPDALRLSMVDAVGNEQRYTAVDGTLYAEWDGWKDAYAALDFDDVTSITLNLKRLQPLLNRIPVVGLPYIPFMFADADVNPIPMLSLYSINPELVGMRMVPGSVFGEGESDRVELRWESTGGSAPIELSIEQASNLVREFRTILRDPTNPDLGPKDGVRVRLFLRPQILAEDEIDPGWFVVNTDDRKDVADFDRLFGGPTILDLVGEPAPQFTIDPVAGHPGVFDLDDWQGTVVVVVFWSPNTEPLFPTLDPIKNLAAWARDEALQVYLLPIALGVTEGPIRDLWRQHELSLSAGLDADGTIAYRDYMVRQIPTAVVIGPEGRVRAVQDGYPPIDTTLEEALKPLILKALDPDL